VKHTEDTVAPVPGSMYFHEARSITSKAVRSDFTQRAVCRDSRFRRVSTFLPRDLSRGD